MILAYGTSRTLGFPTIVLTLVVACFISTMGTPAGAGDRGVAVGTGIAGGAIILNQLAKRRALRKPKTSRTILRPRTVTPKRLQTTAPKSQPAAKDTQQTKSAPKEPSKTPTQIPAETDHTQEGGIEAVEETTQEPAAEEQDEVGAQAPGEDVNDAALPISSNSEIKAAQEHLRYLGYDVPEANGAVDLKTKIATMQFQESIGAEATGKLTVEQLQALFMKVSEKTATAK